MSLFATLKDSWQNRHQWGDDQQDRELAAFLPAALEIQQAPQNPLAKWVGRFLLALFTLVILWACFGQVNIVASAEGKIIPSSRVKKIQPLEKAVIKKILVKEGQYVTEGEPLIELDSVLTQADQTRIRNEMAYTQQQLAVNQGLYRLLEEQEKTHQAIEHNAQDKTRSTEKGSFSLPVESLTENSALSQQLLQQQWQQYLSQYQALQSSLKNNAAEQQAVTAIINKLQQTLPIITQRVKKSTALLKKKFTSEVDHMALEQERIEQSQDLKAEQHRLQQLRAARQEIKQNLNTLTAQTRAQTLTTISDAKRQLSTLNEELTKANDLNAKKILYAPVSGQVQQLAINTIGGVVTDAQELMLIVPDSEQLEVEVFLENKDIGFIREGMGAEIKVHTFPFTKYGIIDAEITNVSNDAILDEQRGLIYSMHVLMSKNSLIVNGKDVKLIPGMAVTAEVQTGYRRIVEFFLAPLLRHGKESLRER